MCACVCMCKFVRVVHNIIGRIDIIVGQNALIILFFIYSLPLWFGIGCEYCCCSCCCSLLLFSSLWWLWLGLVVVVIVVNKNVQSRSNCFFYHNDSAARYYNASCMRDLPLTIACDTRVVADVFVPYCGYTELGAIIENTNSRRWIDWICIFVPIELPSVAKERKKKQKLWANGKILAKTIVWYLKI